MYSCFDKLADVLEAEAWVMLTTVERDGSLLTRPVKSLRVPFRGDIWLEPGDADACAELARGTEAMVTFGDSTRGRHVTVSGWASMIDAEDPIHGACVRQIRAGSASAACEAVLRVSARAAQLWDGADGANARIFAFPPFHASGVATERSPEPVRRARAASWRPSLEQSI